MLRFYCFQIFKNVLVELGLELGLELCFPYLHAGWLERLAELKVVFPLDLNDKISSSPCSPLFDSLKTSDYRLSCQLCLSALPWLSA